MRIRLSIVLFTTFLAGCSMSGITDPGDTALTSLPTVELRSPDGDKNVTVFVEIADDGEERARGLMGREHLDAQQGMLFVFPEPQPLGFWMKNTLIPLDIMFFDEHGALVPATTMEPCVADPCRSYPSEGPALYALEVSAGFMKEYGVGEGWVMRR